MPNAFDDTLAGRVALHSFWRACTACLTTYQATPAPTIIFVPASLTDAVVEAIVAQQVPIFSRGPLGTVFGRMEAPSLFVMAIEAPTIIAMGWRTILALAPDNTLDLSPFVQALLYAEGTALIIQPMVS